MKQDCTQLQEAYIMLTDIFRIVETKQLTHSIINIPIALVNKMDKLYRFVSKFDSVLK
jgi:hypothetical protein